MAYMEGERLLILNGREWRLEGRRERERERERESEREISPSLLLQMGV